MIKRFRKSARRVSIFVAITLATVILVYAWGATGHHFINLKAPANLPASMGWFKADSIFFQDHASDADIRRDNSDTTFGAEQWRHYIDIDAYPDFHNMPHDLDSCITLYGYETVKTRGMNPWATKWVLDSLTAQLARGDTNAAKQTGADLGHYVGDAHQPLHATANYDGQFTGNNGIHSRYETTMINTFQSSLFVHPDSIQYIVSPVDYAFTYLFHTNSLKDSVFAADNYAKAASGWSGSGSPPGSYYTYLWAYAKNFTLDQFQRATIALASLWYTAWVNAQMSPLMFVSPGSLDFGTILVGSNKLDSITISNPGFDTLVISSITSGNPEFSISSSGNTILPGTSKQYYVTFTPIDTVSSVDTITVTHNAPGSPTKIPVHGVGGYSTVHVSLATRWNLISNPVTTANDSVWKLFPTSLYPYVYAFTSDSGYVQRSNMKNGIGFWGKFGALQSAAVLGVLRNSDSIDVSPGWNLVGSISSPVSSSSVTTIGTILQSPFYAYINGYKSADTLKPGRGYWIKVSTSGKLLFGSGSVVSPTTRSQAGSFAGLNRLEIEDGDGNRQTLYFGKMMTGNLSYSSGSVRTPVDLAQYELPPVPPAGTFDARFSTQRIMAAPEKNASKEIPILISSSSFPVKIRWIMTDCSTIETIVIDGRKIPMTENHEEQITSPASRVSMRFNPANGGNIPQHFALEQNYPNPFNPATIIRYQLPVTADVKLRIYNTLGEVVATVVDEVEEAGAKSVEWRVPQIGVASGVYYYRLTAGNYTETKKLLLMK